MKSQRSLFEFANQKPQEKELARTTHGGQATKGRRKTKRPLAKNKPHHLVLKASKAKGSWSFLKPKNQLIVISTLKTQAKKFGIKIADFANVGNHLHITIKFSHAENFQNFLRSTTCLIARKITGARRGHKTGKFWDHLAFTRIIKTTYEQWGLKIYLKANRIEASNGKQARKKFLAEASAHRWQKKFSALLKDRGFHELLVSS